ncbi:cation:proton antiporter domain-containing protein [Natrinema salaciae]|uniref:Kef-type K+ transport system, membrane component KefB n=1 Tax=Natrinema salaciae TaxID=1186196 RepID=A0A1H9FB17_9EURY|nr:cation:proton antiporter [Natrinema salaciae]SEQ35055.1 Kef-type K+ transport system, membrane component KefB [Natrinema salaciae]
MAIIEPLGHHELLLVIVQLTLLLFVARALGEAFSRIGQPTVVGELFAGVLLGPSVLGLVVPGVYESLFAVSESQFHLLEVISWLGLILLLIVTGLETDIDLIVSKGRTAVILSLGGIVVPFTTGFALGWVLPVSFVASPGQRLVFSLFLGTAMSISAIPVIAKVLIELDVIRRDIGQLILAAGMVDDTIGWILLATVAGLARTGVVDIGSVATTIVSVLVFLGVSLTVGRRFVAALVRWVGTVFGSEVALVSTVIVLAFAAGAVTQYMGLEAILGAFVVGVLVGQVKRFPYELRHTLEVITLAVFAPLFFAIAGLRMDVAALFDETVFAVGLVVLGVACFGKFAGIMGASRLAGLSRWEGVTIGGGMNARGAMEIIVATVGLGAGILTTDMYSIIVAVAIATSVIAPVIMRWSIPKIEMSEDERERIEREAFLRGSFVNTLTRILLPVGGGADGRYAARLLDPLVRDRDIDLDVMCVSDGSGASDGRYDGFFTGLRNDRFAPTRANHGSGRPTAVTSDEVDRVFEPIERRLRDRRQPSRTFVRNARGTVAETILDELDAGYDLAVLGESVVGDESNESLFGTTVDRIIQGTTCPKMIVSTPFEPAASTDRADEPIDRILLPTVGTVSNRHAAEIAFTVAAAENALVEIVHVVDEPPFDDRFATRPDPSEQVRIGEQIVEREAEFGRRLDATVLTRVTISETPETEIVDLADRTDADVIVMGANMRPISRRVFLGHRVEYVVRNAPCPVTILSSL